MAATLVTLLSCLFAVEAVLSRSHNHTLYGVFQKNASQVMFKNALKHPELSGESATLLESRSLCQLISTMETIKRNFEQNAANDKYIFTDYVGVQADILRETFVGVNNKTNGNIHFDNRLNGVDKISRQLHMIDELLAFVDSINTPPRRISVMVDHSTQGYRTLTRVLEKSMPTKRKISSFGFITFSNTYKNLENMGDSETSVIIIDSVGDKTSDLLDTSKRLGFAGVNGFFKWVFSERSKESFAAACSRPGGYFFGFTSHKTALSERYIIDTVLNCKHDAGTRMRSGCYQSYKSLNQLKPYKLSDTYNDWHPINENERKKTNNYNLPAKHQPLWPRFRVTIATSYEPWIHVVDLNTTEVDDTICGLGGKFGIRYAKGHSNATVHVCAYGLSIDLLKYFEEKLEFVGVVTVARDGLYGSYNEVTGNATGILGDVAHGRADIALDLMENFHRNKIVDFTTPVVVGGGSMAYIQSNQYDSSVFGPFAPYLWATIVASIIGLMVFVWILERISPYGQYHRQQRTICDTDESFGASESMNYIWGIFLSGEIISRKPQTFGSHISLIVIAFVSILILAAYSANLIAFLVVLDEKPLITGLHDPKLLNDDSKIRAGVVQSTIVQDWLQFNHNYRIRKLYKRIKLYKALKDGIEALKSRHIDVFIADSSSLKHKSSMDHDCAMKTLPLKGMEAGVAIALAKGKNVFYARACAIFQRNGIRKYKWQNEIIKWKCS